MNSSSYPNGTPVGATYIPPSPPADGVAHHYTFILFLQPENWTVPAAFDEINRGQVDALSRLGFNISNFAGRAGLDVTIAANYIRVINGTASQTSSASAIPSQTATAAGGSGSGSAAVASTTQGTTSGTAAAATTSSGGLAAQSVGSLRYGALVALVANLF